MLLGLWLLAATNARTIAQPQHNNWYLGNDRVVNFSTTPPQVLAGSALNGFEGCASFSDEDGNGLFYTDGVRVFDRTGALMPNGSDLAGCISSSQGVVIVPVPGFPSRYYLFTVPSQAGTTCLNAAMSWSMIDLDLNGGYGDVAVQNVPLAVGTTEQITATRHASGHGYWVIAHDYGSDTWYAYPVTCAGVGTAVISHAGPPIVDTDVLQTLAAPGWLDVSHTGHRIASTWNDPSAALNHLDLLYFDPATGVVGTGTSITHNSQLQAYGVQFSPNDHRLYWSLFNLVLGSQLYQYDMGAVDPLFAEVLIADAPHAFGSIQRGRDGVMYMGVWDSEQALATIANPELAGSACGFNLAGLDLTPGFSPMTMSNDWMRDLPPVDLIAWADSSTCASMITIALSESFEPNGYTVLWSNGTSGTSTAVEVSGTYSVAAIFGCDTLRDTVQVHLADAEGMDLLPVDSLWLCMGEGIAITAPPGYASYQWSTGATEPSITAMSTGWLWLHVRNGAGCALSDSILVLPDGCVCDVYLPNAFTPNDDGINDRFGCVTTCALRDVELCVFDRWGHALHCTNTAAPEWDGHDVPVGVYPWILHYARWNGTRYEQSVERGHVALVR